MAAAFTSSFSPTTKTKSILNGTSGQTGSWSLVALLSQLRFLAHVVSPSRPSPASPCLHDPHPADQILGSKSAKCKNFFIRAPHPGLEPRERGCTEVKPGGFSRFSLLVGDGHKWIATLDSRLFLFPIFPSIVVSVYPMSQPLRHLGGGGGGWRIMVASLEVGNISLLLLTGEGLGLAEKADFST